MIIYKAMRKAALTALKPLEKLIALILFRGNNVRHQGFRTNGIPYVMVARGGKCTIGDNFAMNNGAKGNPIGSFRRCTFVVDRGATLTIGDNVGISQAALVCHKSITILNNVKIGGYLCLRHRFPFPRPANPRRQRRYQAPGGEAGAHKEQRLHRRPLHHPQGGDHWRELHRRRGLGGNQVSARQSDMGRQPGAVHQTNKQWQ